MKIINLQAENVKRIKAIEITPTANTVILSGANAQGKSSVLDSIWLALGGGPAAKANTQPVRDGQDEAFVRVDLGDLVVTRKWKGEKTTLEVRNADGAKYSSPQSLLDGLVGRLSFDPLAFAQQDEKSQLKTLLDLVELPFNPAELEATRKELFEDRTDVGRVGAQLDGQLKGMPEAPAGTPDEEVSVSALLAEYRTAQEAHRGLDDAQDTYNQAAAAAAHLREQLRMAETALSAAASTLKRHESQPLPDIDDIQLSIDNAETTNRAVRAKKDRGLVEARIVTERKRYTALTKQLEELAELKTKGIRNAKLPLEELSFNDAGVTYQGVPLKQASSAEQLRVSTAMGMALNPELRMMHIRDGSLLDSTNLALLDGMATAADFQLWIERVDESGSVGVVIEDGQVKE